MRPGWAILAAAILLGCAGGQASGAPLIADLSGAALRSNGDIEPVRWRLHFYRGHFWSARRGPDRDDPGRDGADRFELSVGANRPLAPEVAGPDPRRRRGWVDPPPAR